MQTYCGDGCAAWQGAAERLQRGAELLAKRLDQDDRYYATAAELQKRWKLKVLAPVSFLIAPPKCITQESHLNSADIQCSVSALRPPTQYRSMVTGIILQTVYACRFAVQFCFMATSAGSATCRAGKCCHSAMLIGTPHTDHICDVILQAGPSGHAALLHVDLSLPFQVRGRREPPAEQLPLLRLQDGSVQVRNERQRSDPGRQPSLYALSLPRWLMMRCC